jgi:hypothetical protein
MSIIHFHQTTTLTPEQYIAGLLRCISLAARRLT